MNTYKVTIDTPSITLNVTKGRFKEFKKDEIVQESRYTERFPKIFKKIGKTVGYDSFLAKPKFIPDEVKKSEKKEEIIEVQETLETTEPVQEYFDIIELSEEEFDIPTIHTEE